MNDELDYSLHFFVFIIFFVIVPFFPIVIIGISPTYNVQVIVIVGINQ